jgi:hypothetical protein
VTLLFIDPNLLAGVRHLDVASLLSEDGPSEGSGMELLMMLPMLGGSLFGFGGTLLDTTPGVENQNPVQTDPENTPVDPVYSGGGGGGSIGPVYSIDYEPWIPTILR